MKQVQINFYDKKFNFNRNIINQEKKINKMVSVSENDRKLREIEEAGKRQAEEKLREREDVMYNEILRVHQGTVDTYLDWIFENTIEQG